MNDSFAPCDFTNISGYPNFILDEAIEAIEELPSFLGNNAISIETHLTNFHLCVSKWCHDINHENVKMRLFIFSLDGKAMDWFIELLANSFDSLESIIDVFEEKYGDERKIKANTDENDKHHIKELTQMMKDMQLNQVQLIKTMEVNHAQAIKAMAVNHSNHMATFQNRLLTMEEKQMKLINTMETNHAKEICVMKANQVTFQNRLDEMERLLLQKFQLS